jgi:ferredoxin
MRIHIDDERCKGHGVCCGLCPRVFELTDRGYAISVVDEIPAELQEIVNTAVDHCPEGAISIVE